MEVLEKISVNYRKKERERLFEELYELAFPFVARFVKKMGGGLEEAKDIFQDALVIFYEKQTNPQFIISGSPEAYILGISKHLWLRKFNKEYKTVPLDDKEKAVSIPPDYFPDKSSIQLMQFLEQAGKKCMDLLRAFYFEKRSMKEMTKHFGYSSERSATVQKYKCMEKIRDVIKQKSIGYEDFAK